MYIFAHEFADAPAPLITNFILDNFFPDISVKLHSKGYKVAINSDLIFELDRIGDVSCELN